jgi:hypothetical protein
MKSHYDIPNRGKVVEALVCRVRNGISANYTEPYMRRRDPDCMVIEKYYLAQNKFFVKKITQKLIIIYWH